MWLSHFLKTPPPLHPPWNPTTPNPIVLQVRLPVRCEALLRLLLECLRGASSKYQRGGRDGSSNALRAEMYVCLIQYMHFCRCVGCVVVCWGGWVAASRLCSPVRCTGMPWVRARVCALHHNGWASLFFFEQLW